MAQLTQKLMKRFKAVSSEGLKDTAKECRNTAVRYRACADHLVEAAGYFDDGNFSDGYDHLKLAEASLDKK